MTEQLVWPPRKEDLERLYVVDKLSAMKIADLYGLRYKNPKVAESTVLYQLKRNGIKRRDAAEHVRKVTEEMVDDWIKRYEAGESLKRIAGVAFSPVTVMSHLETRGIRRRDRMDAQIAALTKHARVGFSGGKEMEAYLIGFARGDLNVSRHGRAVRIKTSSTHPLMIEHLTRLFSPYSHLLVYPRRSDLAGYEWSFQADLDSSFSFLVQYRRSLPRWIFKRKYFLCFLAGFFDAEGSIWLNQTTLFDFEISLANSDSDLLETIKTNLFSLGFPCYLGRSGKSSVWHLRMWNAIKVNELLRSLPLRHPEKVSKARIALRSNSVHAGDHYRLVEEWEELLRGIKGDRDRFVSEASRALGDIGE